MVGWFIDFITLKATLVYRINTVLNDKREEDMECI